MRIQWLYWLDGVSQTTEQKEKHGQEKQSHLTSEERLLLKFRSRYTLPQVCHSSLLMSSVYQPLSTLNRTILIRHMKPKTKEDDRKQTTSTCQNQSLRGRQCATLTSQSPLILILFNKNLFCRCEAAVWVVFIIYPLDKDCVAVKETGEVGTH